VIFGDTRWYLSGEFFRGEQYLKLFEQYFKIFGIIWKYLNDIWSIFGGFFFQLNLNTKQKKILRKYFETKT